MVNYGILNMTGFVIDGMKSTKSSMSASTYGSRWKSIINSITKQVSQVCSHLSISVGVFFFQIVLFLLPVSLRFMFVITRFTKKHLHVYLCMLCVYVERVPGVCRFLACWSSNCLFVITLLII